MRVELPELKRCCFCIPLRYGLLASGYIKMAISLLLMSQLVIVLINLPRSHLREMMPEVYVKEMLMVSFFLIFLLLDSGFTIVFLIGGHRKTVKLLHVYYIYSQVILCVYTLLYLWTTGQELYYLTRIIQYIPNGHLVLVYVIQTRIMLGLVVLGIQAYIILLTRSEINKLRNNCSFRFSNMSEAQSAAETGTSTHEAAETDGTVPQGNGTDNQFIGIINQSNGVQGTFNYNQL